MRVSILNGPNLNLLGTREPEIYGSETLGDIETMCRAAALGYSIELTFRQSNHEGALVDWIQEARTNTDALIINAGAFTHTSIALLDALKSLPIPILEVHLSNIYRREEFRQHSYISAAASGLICGLGSKGYLLALEWLAANARK